MVKNFIAPLPPTDGGMTQMIAQSNKLCKDVVKKQHQCHLLNF
jgi:hypothetical protein